MFITANINLYLHFGQCFSGKKLSSYKRSIKSIKSIKDLLIMIEQLYKKYYSTLYQYGCLVHNDKGKVEDVIQNFFIWSIENPKKFNDIRNFEVFACKVIRRNLVQGLIKETLKKENHLKFSKRATFQKNTISIEKEIIHYEEKLQHGENLKNALEELPDKQKEIIYLKYYANMSYQEIEDIMHVSNQVARNYVSRAIKKLKSSLFAMSSKSYIFISTLLIS